MPPTLSFCAESKAKSQNPHPKDTPRSPGEGGPSQTVGEAGEEQFPAPLIRPDGKLLPREKEIFRFFETVDSGTPGKPCV